MPYMGTFHSICVRMLRMDGEHIGIPRSYVIFDEADRLSTEAVDLADRTDFVIDRGDARMARGEVLRAMGRPDTATAAFHKAFDLYSRKGNVVSAERARRAVDELPPWRQAS